MSVAVMGLGKQKSLNSLWNLPEPVLPPQPPQRADPRSVILRLEPHKLANLQARQQQLEELKHRQLEQEAALRAQRELQRRNKLKLVFQVHPEELQELVNRTARREEDRKAKEAKGKFVHPFFAKKAKKAVSAGTPVSVAPPASRSASLALSTSVDTPINPTPTTSKPFFKSAFTFTKREKPQPAPYPLHYQVHVEPLSSRSRDSNRTRSSLFAQLARPRPSGIGHHGTSADLVELGRSQESVRCPQRLVLTPEEVRDRASKSVGDWADNSAIQSLLKRVTNLSAFDTADRESQLWLDKYRPRAKEEVIQTDEDHVGNISMWLNRRLADKSVLKKRKPQTSSFFANTDLDDFIVDDLPSSQVDAEPEPLLLALIGPTCSGKKSALIAACNELELFVFKLNGTTRRTQKELMAALEGLGGSQLVNHRQKSCIILIEDVDVLYEDERGFWTVLERVLEKSKVPVVITASDDRISRSFPTSFDGHVIYEVFERLTHVPDPFTGAMSKNSLLANYLSVMALCEGFQVDKDDIESLLKEYQYDIRRTINHLQFYCQMGLGDPLGGFNWVLPVSEGLGRRVVSDNTYIGVGKVSESHLATPSQSEGVSSREQSPSFDKLFGAEKASMASLMDQYEDMSRYDLYTTSLHSHLDQTESTEADQKDAPLGYTVLDNATQRESEELEWESLGFELEKLHLGNVEQKYSHVAVKELLFDNDCYYSQVNTMPMTTTASQILPYLREMARADQFYQEQFEQQQRGLEGGRRTRTSLASMGVSIPVTHLEWDLDGILETRPQIA